MENFKDDMFDTVIANENICHSIFGSVVLTL